MTPNPPNPQEAVTDLVRFIEDHGAKAARQAAMLNLQSVLDHLNKVEQIARDEREKNLPANETVAEEVKSE